LCRYSKDDVYIERLGGGLYTLELLGIIFASVFATVGAVRVECSGC
jgi:hypothetical protein